MQDVEEALGPDGGSHVLVLFDLDGFKGYNDTFGHPAGDALLARLGRALSEAVASRGNAYRLGGGAVCILLRDPDAGLAAPGGAPLKAPPGHGPGLTRRPSSPSEGRPTGASRASRAL